MARTSAVAAIARRLAAAGVETPEADARLLVGDLPAARLEDGVVRRERREPLQLILGTVGFRYLEIDVAPGVFIPRPETETLAGAAIARTPLGGVVVEPCTGSGAVALAIATEARPGVVHAVDRSRAAVSLARRNAAKVGAPVDVSHGDLLNPVPAALRGEVDVLVSNPPYVAADELGGLAPEVVDWDPSEALVAGPTGHETTDRLVAAATEWLRPGGWLLLESDARRVDETARRAAAAGLEAAAVERDLAGRPRVVLARRPRLGSSA